MKRNCNGCKALNTTFVPCCDLGFKIEGTTKYEGLTLAWKPLEECPKPKTINEYYYLSGMRMRGKPI